MKNKLCLLFCDYFQEEVEWLMKQEHYTDVRAVVYRADCDKTRQASEIVEFITAQATDESVIVFTGVCLRSALEKSATLDFQIEYLDLCFELLLPEDVLLQILAEGAHLFTNGMLKRWPQVNQSWGENEKAKQAFFAEGATKLVLLSNKHLPADEATMAEIARQLGLPWEKLEISLDHLAMRIFQAINSWRGKIHRR